MKLAFYDDSCFYDDSLIVMHINLCIYAKCSYHFELIVTNIQKTSCILLPLIIFDIAILFYLLSTQKNTLEQKYATGLSLFIGKLPCESLKFLRTFVYNLFLCAKMLLNQQNQYIFCRNVHIVGNPLTQLLKKILYRCLDLNYNPTRPILIVHED